MARKLDKDVDDNRQSPDRKGGRGGFEREKDDYQRGMGDQDRGRVDGGHTDRDDDYSELGRRSRFGPRGNESGRHKGGR